LRMIIWLASYPRSGNTFFRILINKLYGLKTYSIYDDPLFSQIGATSAVGHESLPAPVEELYTDPDICFVKTHDFPCDNSAAVYIVRDGRDVLVSYARYILSFNREKTLTNRLKRIIGITNFRRTLRNLITETQNFGGWSNNVLAWTVNRADGITIVLRYEDLVANPILKVQETLGALNLRIEPISKRLPSFKELHKKWPQFFRKGKAGAWKEEMPEDLHRLFWRYHSRTMRLFGYSDSAGDEY